MKTNERIIHGIREQEKLDLRATEAGPHPVGATPTGGWSLKKYLKAAKKRKRR